MVLMAAAPRFVVVKLSPSTAEVPVQQVNGTLMVPLILARMIKGAASPVRRQ